MRGVLSVYRDDAMASQNGKAKADETDETRLQREREEDWVRHPRLHELALFDEWTDEHEIWLEYMMGHK
jgi:hypothetical protein